jgi:D-3-phosphoglycerate dehydrogenase
MLAGRRVLQSAARGSARAYRPAPPSLAKILASDSIEGICKATFKSRGHELVEKFGMKEEELLKIIPEFDGLVVRSSTKVNQKVIEAGINLKMIGRAGTGVDNIDVRAATGRGILVVNTPGGNTISTAELAVSHILALARHIPQATASVKSGKWERSKYSGMELTGKTLGVIGMGKIGKEVAQKCKAFGMSVVCFDPIVAGSTISAAGFHPVTLDELFESSHFITVHTPLTKETRNVINSTTLAQCMEGVRIVNCARGGIVNEADLLAGLESGHVGGAALDTFEVEPPTEASLGLRMHPNVVVTPHLGASTIEAQVWH